ncbi:hypothetical protein GOV08_02905 [Candidatus Woesearchaeota archaeon]|nr:hypothetical protein [Candidatus Woesearchaeota archaeon]
MIRVVIVGALGGDEGKGKCVDEMVNYAKSQNDGKRIVTIRYQGGANAGHTLYVQGKDGKLKRFITHSAPSGLASNVDCAVGPDVAFDPLQFYEELKEAKQIFDYKGKILISERTGVLLDYHKQLDAWRESNEKRKIGTTKSGIGPFYEDNARRTTRITFKDYVSDKFTHRLKDVLELKKTELEKIGIKSDEYHDKILKEHDDVRKQLAPFAQRLEYRMQEYVENGDHVIIEGSQGSLLDVNMGTIPDITSSHLLAPHAFPSLGLSRKDFKIICVEKVYPTRVGEGYLPTLQTDGFGAQTVKRGGEFGATTGRQRRVGYPDWLLAKRAALLNDADLFYITRTDVVSGQELKVCVEYDVDGKKIAEVPLDISTVKPVYLEKTYKFKLWDGHEDVSNVLDIHEKLEPLRKKIVEGGYDNLPKELKEYIEEHDKFIGCKTVGISLGPATGETVLRTELL